MIVTDTFARTVASPNVGTADTGQGWSIRQGTFRVGSGVATSESGGGIATTDHGGPNGIFSVQSTRGAGGMSNNAIWGMVCRFVDTSNYLFAYIHRQGSGGFLHQLWIEKMVAGVSATLSGPTTLTWVANLTLQSWVLGDQWRVVANNIDRTVAIPATPAGTHHGLYSQTGGEIEFDNWSGDSNVARLLVHGVVT